MTTSHINDTIGPLANDIIDNIIMIESLTSDVIESLASDVIKSLASDVIELLVNRDTQRGE